jgi:hypothetical protein
MSGFNLAGAGGGIMQGASAGMSIGGPWGAAAGGLLGLGFQAVLVAVAVVMLLNMV